MSERLVSLLEFLRFMKRAAMAYQQAGKAGSVSYYAVTSRYGIPVVTCLVARGRESWRISNLALEAWTFEDKS